MVLNKKRGETPLELLHSWKSAHPEFQDVAMSYAGRLDPMAEGKMLVLLGEECKKQDQYTKLDKEYEIEVLIGLKTDTGDVLGMPEILAAQSAAAYSRQDIKKALQHEVGPHSRRYPVFSSKTVQGKPLFLYALENKLDTITIPEHIETIYKIMHLSSYQLTTIELQNKIEELLAVVPRSNEPSKILGADFRQDEVRAKWQELLKEVPAQQFTILKLRVICGSGTYMRTLAERIGMSLGSTALALSINRTKMGKYGQFGSIGFWLKQY
jgi:tRNA pseudouridine(55) synthase